MALFKHNKHQQRRVSNRETKHQRTSNLPAARIQLQGHEGEVFSCEFHPDGEILLSSGADQQIHIWSVFDRCDRLITLSGHNGSIMETHFSEDGENIFSCSSDKSVAVWDTYSGIKLRQLTHTSFVNSVNSTMRNMSIPLLCSGCEDGTVQIWDSRNREPVRTISAGYQVNSTCFNGTGNQVIYAGMSNDIAVCDIRMNGILYNLEGHAGSITGISLSPGDGSYLLSNSSDNTLRIWDINQAVCGKRWLKTFTGNKHNFQDNLLRCTWSRNCNKIAAGSSDCHIYIWDTYTGEMQYKLQGPTNIVNDVDFHPKQPIIACACSDQILYLGEINRY